MYLFSLRISIQEENQIDIINNILNIKSNYSQCGWGLEITEEVAPDFSFISYFLSILENKYEKLEQVGIYREDISIWLLYEYSNQCNMEFSPNDLYKLGKEGITLCISCWEKERIL